MGCGVFTKDTQPDTYHSIVGHFHTQVAVAVSVLENHPNLQRSEQICNREAASARTQTRG